jgi:hypothetical protein
MTDPQTAGSGYERSFRSISALANVDDEIAYYTDGTIVLALDESVFYKYNGTTWEVYSWPGAFSSGNLLEGADIDLVTAGENVTISRGGDTILLLDHTGNPMVEYARSALGTAGSAGTALGDAVSGQVVEVPPGTYGDDHVLPAGVVLVGVSQEKCVLTGQITLGNGSAIWNLSVVRTANDANILKGLVGPTSGTANVKNCTINVAQSGSGNAYGVYQPGGTQSVTCYYCQIDASSGSGESHGVYHDTTASGPGTLINHTCFITGGHTGVVSFGDEPGSWSQSTNSGYGGAKIYFRLQSPQSYPEGCMYWTIRVLSGSVPGISQISTSPTSPSLTHEEEGYRSGDYIIIPNDINWQTFYTDGYLAIQPGGFASWAISAQVTRLEWVMDGDRIVLWDYQSPSSASTYLYYCKIGASTKCLNATGGDSISVYACQYDPASTSGTITLLPGDRAAYNHTHAQLHDAVTISDTTTVDLTLVGQALSAAVLPGGIKLDDLGVPDDNTDLNASTTRHGLLPKLSGNADHALKGDGTWATSGDAWVLQENHSSSCDGATTDFSASTYYQQGKTMVWLNGLLQTPGVDYSENIDNQTLSFSIAPIAGDSLIVAYIVGEIGVVPSGPYTTLSGTEVVVLTIVHDHTTESDGSLSPADLVSAYLSDGVGALAITDHDLVSVQPDGITSKIEANECTTSNGHVLSLGCNYTRGATTAIQSIINGVDAAGGMSVLAHPNWSVGFSLPNMQTLTGYRGIEIYNHIVASGAGGSSPITYPGFCIDKWDSLLTNTRKDIWGFAGDDYHSTTSLRGRNRGRLKVFVDSNSTTNILNAIASGNFVAEVGNAGVTPGIPYVSNLDVSVTCVGATKIRFVGQNGTLLEEDSGETGSYGFVGTEGYVRIEAVGDYAEGFDSAIDTANEWGVSGGTWAVNSGVLQQSNDTIGPFWLILKRHLYGDIGATCYFCLRSSGPDRQIGFLFNLLDINNTYYLQLLDNVPDGFRFYKWVGGVSTLVGSHIIDIADNIWYRIRLNYTQATGTIQARIWQMSGAEPGVWHINTTDTSLSVGGAFGFRSRYASDIDNLYIDGFKTYYQPIALG